MTALLLTLGAAAVLMTAAFLHATRTWRPAPDDDVRWAALIAGVTLVIVILGIAARCGASTCARLVAGWRSPADPDRVATCERIARLADEPVRSLAVALAYHETHFGEDCDGAVRGALQVAACHCPGRTHDDCDHDLAGVAALLRLLGEESGSERVALRRWLVGPRGRRGPLDARRERWIAAVIGTAREIEAEVADAAAER